MSYFSSTDEENSFTCGELLLNDTGLLDFFDHHRGNEKDFLAAHLKNIKEQIVQKISDQTGLLYAGKNQPGNVCFANNNEDLRDEFKQVFSTMDLLEYVFGCLKALRVQESASAKPLNSAIPIPYPQNAENFWELVNRGK